jgi:hypothetical protein
MQLASEYGMDGFQQRGFADFVVAHYEVHVGIE